MANHHVMDKKRKKPFEYEARFRFYAELNDFLPHNKAKKIFYHNFNGSPSLKDPIEAIGVPHTEVDLLIVNGLSAGFDYRLQDGDFVSVYPVFKNIDISPIVKLRGKPLNRHAFILDVHLGRLAKMLRMIGFDTMYRNDYNDAHITQLSVREQRIILTRDRRLLHKREVTHGYCIRSTNPELQLHEVIRRFDLQTMRRPFYRCMICNGLIQKVDKDAIEDRLEPGTRLHYYEFHQCVDCDRIYWKGSHYQQLKARYERIRSECNE